CAQMRRPVSGARGHGEAANTRSWNTSPIVRPVSLVASVRCRGGAAPSRSLPARERGLLLQVGGEVVREEASPAAWSSAELPQTLPAAALTGERPADSPLALLRGG